LVTWPGPCRQFSVRWSMDHFIQQPNCLYRTPSKTFVFSRLYADVNMIASWSIEQINLSAAVLFSTSLSLVSFLKCKMGLMHVKSSFMPFVVSESVPPFPESVFLSFRCWVRALVKSFLGNAFSSGLYLFIQCAFNVHYTVW
jgi:hypothetical protein